MTLAYQYLFSCIMKNSRSDLIKHVSLVTITIIHKRLPFSDVSVLVQEGRQYFSFESSLAILPC